jgi:uncharacterized RDD family membrane protein YckC
MPPSADIDTVAASTSEDGAPLADRGTRLGASLLDGLLASIPMVIAMGVAMVIVASDVAAHQGLGREASEVERARQAGAALERMVPMFVAMGLGALGMLGVTIFQWYRITTTGQSVAKKWLKIKIVNLDGSPVNFGSGVGMRALLPGFINWVPYLGFIFWLVDVLFIFRDDRRCLHDLMAGTKVIAIAPRE